jgi:hypothetical protein
MVWAGTAFPLPLAMAFPAKSSELISGILVFFGFLTRPAALLIAFTMTVATLTANLGDNWNIDGGFTISYTLFALVLFTYGSGHYSLDYLISKKKLTGTTGRENIIWFLEYSGIVLSFASLILFQVFMPVTTQAIVIVFFVFFPDFLVRIIQFCSGNFQVFSIAVVRCF